MNAGLVILFFTIWFQSSSLVVSSPDFVQDGEIPRKFSCDGEEINPALNIENLPGNAQSLVLIMEDPDVPLGKFTHWVVWNIPVQGTINQNSIPGIQGTNSVGKNSYIGPCPNAGTHRYFFKIFALSSTLELSPNASRREVEAAMKDHIVARGEIMGRYHRKPSASYRD